MKNWLFLFLLLLSGFTSLYAQQIIALQAGKNTSIRGLSIVDNFTAWVSGSKGWTSITTDGGKSWRWVQIPGYETFDFRDIEAFSKTDAVIVSAGTPAVILLTNNGGIDWKEVYRNESPDIFLDGMDFKDSRSGIIYGDPIKGKMQLLRTVNGGLSWTDISSHLTANLIEGEASFAASGTAIRTLKNGKTFIVSGGSQSRIFVSDDFGDLWKTYACPIIQGKSSTGPFSIAFLNKRKGVAVGGDYLSDTSSVTNMLLTTDGGKTWGGPETNPFGYKSSVEFISSDVLVATGTSGTDISTDKGKNWQVLTKEGFNTVRKAKSGSLVLLAGANGKISILQMSSVRF